MITYDISKAAHYTGKDGEQAFRSWCDSIKVNQDQFPFNVNTYRYTRQGKTIIYRVVSWGCYLNSDNQWIIFIAYRCAANGANVQYNWFADEKGLPMGDPTKHEFVN